MCFGGQGIHKERSKEALGAGSVEELGCITSNLTLLEERNAILIHGLKCRSDLGEASKVPKTMIVCSFCCRQFSFQNKTVLGQVS